MKCATGRVKNQRAGQVYKLCAHLYFTGCKIILRHTHIIKKDEIYQKPKRSVVWVGET